jgi:hypothetical protein
MAYPKMTVGEPTFVPPKYGMNVGQMSPMMGIGDIAMYGPGITPITEQERIALDRQIAQEKQAPYISQISPERASQLNAEIASGKWGQPVTKDQANDMLVEGKSENPFLAALQSAPSAIGGLFAPSVANASKEPTPGDGKLPEKSGVDRAKEAADAQSAALQAALESAQPGKAQNRLYQSAAQYRPAYIGDRGLGALASQSSSLLGRGKSRVGETTAALKEAQERQELALDAQSDAQAQRYERVAQAKSGAVQAITAAQSQMDELSQRRAKAKQSFDSKMADAQLQSQYALMPLDEIKKNQAVLADSTADSRAKAQAKMALENAGKSTDKRSVGKKILGAIAAGFGAYASAMTGGPNFALQMINDAINRDIQSQRELFGRAKGRIGDLQNDYARNMQVFGDEKLAILETQRQKLMAVDAKVDEISANLGPEMAAKRELIKGQLAEQIALKTNQLQQLGEAQEAQSIGQQLQIAGQRLGVDRMNQAARLQAQSAAANAGMPGTTDISGLVKTGRVTQKQSDNVRQFMSSQRELDSLFDRMIDLRGKYDIAERAKNQIGMSDVAATLEALGGRAFNVLRKKNEAGAALTEAEIMAQDPKGILQNTLKVGFGQKQLSALKEANRQGIKEFLRTNNYDFAPKQVPSGFTPWK